MERAKTFEDELFSVFEYYVLAMYSHVFRFCCLPLSSRTGGFDCRRSSLATLYL